ncbi:MAG: zinc-binding dehydrogenase [Candidatus Dormibacteraceae bacterium]
MSDGPKLRAEMLALVAAPGREENVELRQVAEPVAGSGETLIEVRAISLNRGEVNRLAQAADGWRPGWDVAGTVLERAADGSGPAAGDRVVGLSRFGGWCQRLAIPSGQLAAIPGGVTDAQAACLPVAGLTALRTLRRGGLLLGRQVLATGAAGGVGRFAIQLADQAGAHVTAVVGAPERSAGLLELGADEVSVGIAEARGPFDLILEAAGGASLAAALKLVGENGRVVSFGNSSREPTTFLVNDFYMRSPRLEGFFLLAESGEPVGPDLTHLQDLVVAGRLDVQLSLEESWENAARALRELRERRVPGKAVLHLT